VLFSLDHFFVMNLAIIYTWLYACVLALQLLICLTVLIFLLSFCLCYVSLTSLYSDGLHANDLCAFTKTLSHDRFGHGKIEIMGSVAHFSLIATGSVRTRPMCIRTFSHFSCYKTALQVFQLFSKLHDLYFYSINHASPAIFQSFC
jgi:hypothetical protein